MEEINTLTTDLYEQRYFKWTCGCQSRIEPKCFVVIPCSPTCLLYLGVLEEADAIIIAHEEVHSNSDEDLLLS